MKRSFRLVLACAILAAFTSQRACAQAIIQPGAGALNLSMAGASTAMGVDALGALYWNPAAISGLPHSEVVIGAEFILPDIHEGTEIPAGAFGPLGPATTQSGLTRSNSGLVPATGLGIVYKPEDSKLTFGMGLATLAAGGVNFPGNGPGGNPLFAPTGPLGQVILGPQAASILVLALEPSVSYQVTDRLAFGIGPMVDVSAVSFDPAFFGPLSRPTSPLPPPLGPAASFPTGSHTRPFWGGGFRAGVTYKVVDHLVAGFSYSSPQWFQNWVFNARDANGNPLTFQTGFSLPQIFSAGLAFDGIDKLLVTTDLRWFDYSTTALIGQPPSQGGAGWESIWAVAVGARYKLTDRLSAQAGYIFNENPISSNLALFNTELPLINQHTMSFGSFFQLNDSIGISAAWVHGFKNSISGSVFQFPAGTSTTLQMGYDAFVVGIHISFGPAGCKDNCNNHGPVVSADVPTSMQ
jgi:long-chain fatty acid transport protein